MQTVAGCDLATLRKSISFHLKCFCVPASDKQVEIRKMGTSYCHKFIDRVHIQCIYEKLCHFYREAEPEPIHPHVFKSTISCMNEKQTGSVTVAFPIFSHTNIRCWCCRCDVNKYTCAHTHILHSNTHIFAHQ